MSGVFLKGGLLSPPKSKCLRNSEPALEAILNTPRIDAVVLSARWPLYVTGTRFGAESGTPVYLTEKRWGLPALDDNASRAEAGLVRVLGALEAAGKTAVIVLPVPEFGFDPVRCFKMAIVSGKSTDLCSLPRETVDRRQQTSRDLFLRLADRFENVRLVAPVPLFCSKETCRPAIAGKLAYEDDDHVNPAGAHAISGLILEAFK